MEENKGEKPTPKPLKTTKPPFPCNSRNNLLKSYCTHPPCPPLCPLPKGPLSSPFLKVFDLFRKGGNRFGDKKSLGRKKEIKFSIFLLLSLNFRYNPIPPHFIPPHSTLERKKITLDL
jgi:hypothetical protein